MAEKARTSYISEGIDWPREDSYVSSSRGHIHPRELFQNSVFPFSRLSSQSSVSKEISNSGLHNDNSDCEFNSSQGSINSNILIFPPPHPSKFEPSIIKPSTHSSQGEYNSSLHLPPLKQSTPTNATFESPPITQSKPAYIWDPDTLPPLYPPPSDEEKIIKSPAMVSPPSTLPSSMPSNQKDEVISKFNINNEEYEAALALQSLMRHSNIVKTESNTQPLSSQTSIMDESHSVNSSQAKLGSYQDYHHSHRNESTTPPSSYPSNHIVDIVPINSNESSPIEIDPVNDIDSPTQSLAESQEASASTTGKKKTNNNYKRSKSKASSSSAAGVNNEEDSFQWQALNIPDSLWEEALNTYDRVKTHKSLLSRQTSRRHNAALASIVIILCRKRGLPRTFTEICTMTGVSKREIGTFYKLMLSILEVDGTEVQRLCPEQFMKRWCQALVIPEAITNTAIKVLQEADKLGISTGKCPNSSCAASIWLTVRYYNAYIENFIQSRAHLFESGKHYVEPVFCELKDVAEVTGVAMATVNNSFRNLLPHRFKLLPLEALDELMSSQVRTRLPLIEPSVSDKHNRSSSPVIVDSL